MAYERFRGTQPAHQEPIPLLCCGRRTGESGSPAGKRDGLVDAAAHGGAFPDDPAEHQPAPPEHLRRGRVAARGNSQGILVSSSTSNNCRHRPSGKREARSEITTSHSRCNSPLSPFSRWEGGWEWGCAACARPAAAASAIGSSCLQRKGNMSSTANQFSAADSALGYLYQARLGLLWALKRLKDSSDFVVSLETIDDVTFETNGRPDELLQTRSE